MRIRRHGDLNRARSTRFDTTSNPLEPSVRPLVHPFVSGRVDNASCVGDHEVLPAIFREARRGAPAAVRLVEQRGGRHDGRAQPGPRQQRARRDGQHEQGELGAELDELLSTNNYSALLAPSVAGSATSTAQSTPIAGARTTWFMARARTRGPRGVQHGQGRRRGRQAHHAAHRRGAGRQHDQHFHPIRRARGGKHVLRAFALEMQPAFLPGQTQLSAQQSASCPRRGNNLAAMSDLLSDYQADKVRQLLRRVAKLTRYGYSAAELCAVDTCVTTAAPSATGAPSSPVPASQPASPTKAEHGDAEHGDAEHGDAEHGDAPSTATPSTVTPTKQPASSQAPSSAPTWLPSSPSQTPTTSRRCVTVFSPASSTHDRNATPIVPTASSS
jgi:hypothetical protein